MNKSSLMKWITGGLEAFWGLPIIGGIMVMSLSYIPLGIMLILHIITLVLSINEGKNKHGSIVGIVTSCIAFIPFVGWVMHVVTAVLLMVDANRSEKVIEVK